MILYTSMYYLYALEWYQIIQTLLEAQTLHATHSLQQVCKDRNPSQLLH